MRYIIIYLLFTYTLVGKIIEVSPVFSKNKITKDELSFNLKKNHSLTLDETFRLASLTSDKKYLIGIAHNKFNNKESKIFIFDRQTKEIKKVIKKNYKITAIRSFKKNLFLGDSNGFIYKVDNINQLDTLNTEDKILDLNGYIRNFYIDNNYSIIDFYREENNTISRVLEIENKVENKNKDKKIFQEVIIDNQKFKNKWIKDKIIKNMTDIVYNENIIYYNVDKTLQKINMLGTNIPIIKQSSLENILSNQKNKHILLIRKNYLLIYNKDMYSLYFQHNNSLKKELYSIKENKSTIESITLNEDKRYLLIIKDSEIKIYDILNKSLIAFYHTIPIVTHMLFTNDAKYIIVSTNTGYIHVWDIQENKLVNIIPAHNKKILFMDISKDGKYLATGSEDDFIKIWDIHDVHHINKINEFSNKKTYDITWLYFYKSGIIYKAVNNKKEKFYDFKLKILDTTEYYIHKFNRNLYGKFIYKEIVGIIKNYKMLDISTNKNYHLYQNKKKEIKLTDLSQDVNTTLFPRNQIEKTFLKISPNNHFFTIADKNGNIHIFTKDGNLSKIFKDKDDGSWIAIDKEKMEITKGDSSKIWSKKKHINCNIFDENRIKITFPKEINITEGIKTNINISIKNKTNENFSFIHFFLKKDSNFILKPNNLRILEANKTAEINLTLLYVGENKNSLEKKLIFNATIDECIVANNYSSNISIKKFALEVKKITIDENENKPILYKNIGNINTKFQVFIDNESPREGKININQTKKIYLSNLDKEENSSINGTFLNLNPPYNQWDFNKTILYEESIPKILQQNQNEAKNQFLWIFFVLLVVIYISYTLYFHNKIEKTLDYIFKIPPYKLKRNKRFLSIAFAYHKLLRQTDISTEQVDFTIDFLENKLDKDNNFFKKRLKNNIKSIDVKDGLYLISLPKKFSLNISQLYLCLKENDDLREMESMRNKNLITIIISKRQKIQREIIRKNDICKEKYEKDSIPYNKIITPTIEEIMKLLLAKDYEKALIKILVNYIAPKHISPFDSKVSKYQYIDKKKERILNNLTSKKIKNLFIIGANGSGKSYLLERIAENLKKTSSTDTVLFINKTDYKQMYKFVYTEVKKTNNNIIFLIDDVDNFILDKDTYKIFDYFKELHSQKNVFFIMTGFWTLYKELNLKEKSPLKSFGLEKNISTYLDSRVARDMIQDYMKILHINFESDNIINDIIFETGGNLELINLICHKLIKQIDYNEKLISKETFLKVLNNKKVLNYIDTLDNFDNTLERFIIYGMIKKSYFSLKDVATLLDEYAIHINSKEIKDYLKKLELYNIIELNNEKYKYKISLLQKSLLKKKNIQGLLEVDAQNYKNILPTVKNILASPIELYDYSFLKLHTIYKQLQNTKSIDSVINSLEIEKKSFETVKDAFSKKTPQYFDNMIRLFSEKINTTFEKKSNYYLIKVSNNNFPLKIDKFIIHFSNETDYKTIKSLFNGHQITILITTKTREAQNNLYEKTLDKTDKFIAPQAHEVTKIFLNPSREKVLKLLSDIFSRHLRLDSISPYQPNQSINDSSMFFGREDKITKVTQREIKNYLVMGARRVGKSSLLKAIYRKLKDNKTIESYYFALSQETLEEKLIDVLNLTNISTLKEVKNYLKKQNKSYIFLIDETDDFIEMDKKNNYHTLKILREMSEEKYAFFLLAGFWQLYKSKWEQKSPLLNFGESMEIGELEFTACKDFIKKPMQSMNIEFEDEELIEYIIYQLGQKAQLISLTCSLLVKEISNNKSNNYYITKKDISKSFEDRKFKDEIGKWIELEEEDEKIELLTKIIVYSMLKYDTFDLSDIQTFLKKQDIHINYKKVEDALELLELGFILKEKNRVYNFRVPQQRKYWLTDNIKLKLDNDIEDFKK